MIFFLFLDVVVSQHPAASVSSVHAAIGSYLKMAPYREGGAGKGCRVAQLDERIEEEELQDHDNELECDETPSLGGHEDVAARDDMSDVESDSLPSPSV